MVGLGTTMYYGAEASAEASRWNITNVNLEDLKMDSNFALLLCSLISAIVWVIYITYYNSRLAGYILTKILNRFYAKDGYLKIGSFTLNALAGKIMFRDVVYITHDYSVRVQDGYLIFRWWRSYVPKDVSEDLSHSDTRLSVVLNGFELHFYNRCEMYARLEKVFGFESDDKDEKRIDANKDTNNEETRNKEKKPRPEAALARTWRDLIPVIKMDISSSRVVFGNRLVPTTLSIAVEESHFVYSTKPAVNTLDRFMHFVKSKAENARVMLAPSPKYTGMLDEPPRYMGEGFVLMSTNDIELYFYMDEAGIVPEEPVHVILANGDVVESSPPMWGVDIKCGKGTNFSYGPWADRQREHLFKFFYPPDFLPMAVTPTPLPGDKRQMQSFDVRLSLQNESTIDVLFSKNKETNAVHVNVGAGSYMEIVIPWVTTPTGYTTKVNGQLLHLDATTSLQYRDLITSETLEFGLLFHYPLLWNDHQLWELSVTGCKVSVHVVFTHKWFFQDLINDWASKQRPDLIHFVPYTWRFTFTLKHCELITLINQYNWIDCSSVGQRQRLENTQIALCAHFLHLSFALPFDEFLPATVPLNFSIQGESVDLSLFIPEYHTSRNTVLSLEKYAKVLSKDGASTKKTENIPKWRNMCQPSCGWVDFWWVPIGAINIGYVYHPAPPLGPKPQADISTPVKEELLLSPIRFPHRKTHRPSRDGAHKFDPTTLNSDKVTVELEVGPSVLLLYGTALRNFLNFKENIFGEDQAYVDMQNSSCTPEKPEEKSATPTLPLELQDDFDQRYYRPLDVDVSIILHDVQAHLLKYCNENDPPCPVALVERFGFEMKKRFDQTELQLLVSPSVLLVTDNQTRPSKDKQLNQGRVTLSALQIRGHAMFSDVGRSLDQETIEYAWLLEVQLGKISARLTAPQLHSICLSLETLVLLVMDAENELNAPKTVARLGRSQTTAKGKNFAQNISQNVQQTIQQFLQTKTAGANLTAKSGGAATKTDSEKNSGKLPRKADVKHDEADEQHKMKYKFCRVAVDAIDFWLVEAGTAIQLWLSPLRLSTCNLHGKQVGSGLSCIAYGLKVRQMVWQPHRYNHTKQNTDNSDVWFEIGAIRCGPLMVESVMSGPEGGRESNLYAAQQRFLKSHDERWRKLWFLWTETTQVSARCGCVGGCSFFGGNRNGERFFKPSGKDLQEGVNVAAYLVNEPGRDPGFGQSILHEGFLIFRTPPYVVNEITLQESRNGERKPGDSPRASTLERSRSKIHDVQASFSSPISLNERKVNRRFSSTSMRSKDVPYARLVDSYTSVLPGKLDSDSKLHFNKGKCALNVPENELMPKSSISDSRLAVDYFVGVDEGVEATPPTTTATKPVNASESHHCLSSVRVHSDEQLPKDIERTLSISSENHSEAFFSADEELNVNSRSSSLRNSIVAGTLNRRELAAGVAAAPKTCKKYSSELSIVADKMAGKDVACSAPTQNESGANLRLPTHRSDHEIHTPQHRILSNRKQMEDACAIHVVATPSTSEMAEPSESLQLPENDSSDAYSNASYASAMGSQEDLTLIDLHMQINRQIMDSPLLMSSYVSHLSQLKCTNWTQNVPNACDTFSVPLFRKCEDDDGKLVYVGGRFVPTMETLSDGITSLKMIGRCEGEDSPLSSSRTPTTGGVAFWDQHFEETDPDGSDEEMMGFQGDVGNRTSLIVKIKGDLDIVISPLVLESLQRYVDSLTAIVSSLHPSTVIDHLHASCVAQVAAANVLKRPDSLCTTLRRTDGGAQLNECEIYEEIIKSQLQAAVTLPKVNVTLLQVSIVEEIISFSALDNIRDLTCVSVFSVCLNNVTARLHCDKQAKEVLQTFHRPAVVQMGSKKVLTKAKAFLLGQHNNTIADIVRGEPVSIENSETKQEQVVVCLSIGKVHAQLRRLRNESTIIDDAVITSIPAYFSKVLFAVAKVPSRGRQTEYYLDGVDISKGAETTYTAEPYSEDKLGFIMFEGGLEGITLKIVKKSRVEQNHGEVEEIPVAASATAAPAPSVGDESTETADAGNVDEPDTTKPVESATCKDNGNVSSCVIELKTVWFNFAAPPRTPITRKIDYTRLDWNLLSTASPAINAWMNPSNRFAIRLVHMMRSMYKRSTAIVACLMAEALDVQGIHLPTKSRYGILTPLAKTLQEDPSCQLCTILQKYLLQVDLTCVEASLREGEMPQLSTLRQGVIVLSRQWKNILYTPLLLEPNTKTRVKPLNVTIAMPQMDEEVGLTDGEASGNEETDCTDEHATLLHTAGIVIGGQPLSSQQQQQQHRGPTGLPTRTGDGLTSNSQRLSGQADLLSPQVAVVAGGIESVLTSPSPPVSHRKRKTLHPSTVPSSSRASIVFPLIANANSFLYKKNVEDGIGYGTLREDKAGNVLGSDPSVCTHSSLDLPSTPLHRPPPNHTHSTEDLYSWMAKQDREEEREAAGALRGFMESKIDTLHTSVGEGATMGKDGCVALYPMQDSLRLLDAHFIFQPLLSSLGVMSRQLVTTITGSNTGSNVTSLDALGSNLSLVAALDVLRIDIVVSEHGKIEKIEKKKGGKAKGKTHFTVELHSDEASAFMCEKISIEVEMDRKADMTVNDMIKTKNVLYISRGQLKKHTSTVLNCNIGVNYIAQRVNMPLLRLLHQITNMYQNVKETQNELKEQQPTDMHRPKTSTSNHTDIKRHSSSDLTVLGTTKRCSLKTSDHGSVVSQPKTGLSPSPSVRSRPQSFAQKLRSTGKSVRGYVNLSEGAGTPAYTNSPSGSALERISHASTEKGGVGGGRGRCWKTIYHLLDLYATMPDTKTITHRFSVGVGDISEYYKGNRKYDLLMEVKSNENIEKGPPENATPIPTRESSLTTERTKLVVFGVAKINRTKLLATLSGLKLDAEITGLHSSLTCRNKSRPISFECSITGQIGKTNIKLLEGVAPNQLQTVVKATVGKSQTLYSSVSRRGKDKNSALLTVGAVVIEIPQHPVALHGMVTRSSKQLSSTLQELRVTRTSSRLSRGAQADEESGAHAPPNYQQAAEAARAPERGASVKRATCADGPLMQPLLVQFSVMLQSFSVTAALLPSLQAQYKMDQLKSMGTTGSKAKFTIDLPQHTLSFTTRLPLSQVMEVNLPPEACIALPVVHVSAEYIPEGATGLRSGGSATEGVVFRQGGYLSAQADIGVFEHSLTTDLLNHLVFVQNIFMKEVNEVIQKVYGGERPVPIWLEDADTEPSTLARLLFSLIIKVQRIQLTATTAGSSAVRLETGAVTLELSNRVQNVSGATQSNSTVRLFGRAQVDVNLSLGQLMRNALFEEAEAEFQQFAFFNTRIGVRNAFQDELVEGEDKEVVLITLKRPLIYVQPVAVDKAILVWLNYKNAYDYWTERRAHLTGTTAHEKLQIGHLTSQLSAQHLGTLFLQLTVEDMGICLPLNPIPISTWGQRNAYEDCRGAVVVTLESTSISACSSGSLVSKGKFTNLCLRFADDFETSLDDWKPDMGDCTIMNLCVVTEGTYEVCSRTIAAKQPNENAKWFLSVQWQMEGVDIHLDTNVGKQLSSLGHTLTSLTGTEDPPFRVDYDSDECETAEGGARGVGGASSSQESILPPFMFDPTLDNRQRSKLIEKEMNEQAKIINDLRTLGASHGTIELEMKRLHELEALVYKDFRRDMIQKLRRQSVKASSMTKGKLGVGNSAYRSKSFIASSTMAESKRELDSSPENATGSFESSPRSGPSRSASLRVRPDGPRVTFSDTQQPICRQSSLPTARSDLNLSTETTSTDWSEHLNVDGERVELRRKLPPSYESEEGSSLMDTFHLAAPYQGGGLGQKSQDPNIDLELDVNVFINSGKCVLHTKDAVKEEEIKLSRMRKDRSSSAGLLDFPPTGSPDPHRKNKEKLLLTTTSASRLRTTPHTSLVDLTIFHIPGMDVKLHYQSKVQADNVSQQMPSRFAATFNDPLMFDSSLGFGESPSTGRMDEARIDNAFKRRDSQNTTSDDLSSPNCAAGDFTDFDATEFEAPSMQGITNPNYSSDTTPAAACDATTPPFQMDVTPPHETPRPQPTTKRCGTKKASLFAWMTLQSIPEETIISPHILEFLEQTLEPIPAKTFTSAADTTTTTSSSIEPDYGNYVYASFPVDVIVYFHMQPSTFRFSCLPVSRVECMLQLPSLDIVFSSKRAEDELLQSVFGDDTNLPSTAVGGLSVTGCMSDFSVYIFHPYGGKKSALKEAQWSPLSDSERKDSLSINVEFVKFHLSRSRMLNVQADTSKGKSDQTRAVIRFSTITDIGSASFKYDMRRLTEILAFPKAWYRRSIVRRLFLGDLGMPSVPKREREPPSPETAHNSSKHDRQKSDKSPQLNKDKLKLIFDGEGKRIRENGRSLSNESGFGETNRKNVLSWETLLLVGVNFKRLNVHMNMGNVMGNVSWLTKDFRSDARLNIGSSGHKNLYLLFGLGGSSLDAKGGIVGGNIEIAEIDTCIHIQEEPETEPHHRILLRLHALELRFDYMATSVLMCRVSELHVNLRDEWILDRTNVGGTFNPTKRPASIFGHGDLSWDQLQMMISKSSTADLLKMFNKLEEFFAQQFNSSKRAFSGFSQARARAPRVTPQKSRDSCGGQQVASASSETQHHRHWQRVLAHIAGLHLTTMHWTLPPYGTVLGGTMELHGNNISLACFHGINFKSKSWALFSLKEPCITFNTEAQQIPQTGASDVCTEQDVHIVQTLTCSLGLSTYKTHHSMATVCKVSRNVIFPPQFKSLQEWFQYAFASSQIDEVDRFPSLEKERLDGGTSSIERNRANTSATKGLDQNHTREVIFALPSLQLHLKTEHLQAPKAPDPISDEKPMVECSFITEFEDHIFVTVDAEAFFFLHDLITSYLREKEKVMATEKRPSLDLDKTRSNSSLNADTSPGKKSLEDIFTNDFREYNCKTWHLEPTVRLLSVAGKYIEPYGIDYILQKLGFAHARTTIPKWMQRGFMDPLDAILAVLTLQMVQVVKTDGNKLKGDEKKK